MFETVLLLSATFFIANILQVIHSTFTQSKLAIKANIISIVTDLKQNMRIKNLRILLHIKNIFHITCVVKYELEVHIRALIH